MLNCAHILTNVSSINCYQVAVTQELRNAYAPFDFYVQLWQSDLGIRYIPATDATLKVEFLRADTVAITPVTQTVTYTKAITDLPFATDASIWKFTLTAADIAKIVTGGFRLTLTETVGSVAVTRVLFISAAIRKLPDQDI